MSNLLLYQRIAQQLAEDIRRGVYQPGERVPSVRKLSTQLNVSHATVLQAYATLEDQGLIRARPQSGYYVHRTPALTASTPDIARVERPGLVTRSISAPSCQGRGTCSATLEDRQMSTESSAKGSAVPEARTKVPVPRSTVGPAACISLGSGSTAT